MTTRIMKLATIVIFLAGFAVTFMPQIVAAEEQGVLVTVKGESWDSDSMGFAFWGALALTLPRPP